MRREESERNRFPARTMVWRRRQKFSWIFFKKLFDILSFRSLMILERNKTNSNTAKPKKDGKPIKGGGKHAMCCPISIVINQTHLYKLSVLRLFTRFD